MTPPTGGVAVVAAVICREGRYLVGRRPPGKRHAGLWEFPGGKVRAGESRTDAVRRELAEELSLELGALGRVLSSTHDVGSPFVIHFLVADALGEPVASEHSEVGWFTARELLSLPLAPADALFVRGLPLEDV